MNAIFSAWNDSVAGIENVTGIVFTAVLEPLPPQLYSRHASGNALGLGSRNGTALSILLISATWSDAQDDEKVADAAQALTAMLSTELASLGALDPFLYLNYAAPWQQPLQSYGRASLGRLREIGRKYDPHAVFTRQCAGGFKLS